MSNKMFEDRVKLKFNEHQVVGLQKRTQLKRNAWNLVWNLFLLNEHTHSEFNCSNLSSTNHYVSLTKSLNLYETNFIISKLELHLAIHRTLLGSNREEKATTGHINSSLLKGTHSPFQDLHTFTSPRPCYKPHTICMSISVKQQQQNPHNSV